jgi:hypothetical protein
MLLNTDVQLLCRIYFRNIRSLRKINIYFNLCIIIYFEANSYANIYIYMYVLNIF